VPDTVALLSSWDKSISLEENLRLARQGNILGKASRSRVQDILKIFHQRYLGDPSVGGALVTLARGGLGTEELIPALYFFSARADRLLHDAVTNIVEPMSQAGQNEVSVDGVSSVISRWVDEGKTFGHWSPATVRRAAEGILTTLRDFGILRGLRRKTISSVYLPPKAFAFIAYELSRHRGSGEQLLHDPEWRLFLLSTVATEKLFLECHQRKLLEYYAIGRVVRIEFGAPTLEEYADGLIER
jgi:hypothetical protein